MTIPSIKKANAVWKKAETEDAFWQKHRDEFLEKYPDQFVAVHERSVIVTSRNLEELASMLTSKGLDLQKVWVRFITTDPTNVLL